MDQLFLNSDYTDFTIGMYAANAGRYILFSGMAWLVFYMWKKKHFAPRKIQVAFPETKKVRTEIIYSFITFIFFALTALLLRWLRKHDYTFIYLDIHQYGKLYFVVSVFLMLFIHDTYFYWTHRFMHLKNVFPVFHRIHHLSNNPSPWAAFSFHPLEAVIEVGVLPLIVFIMPVHPLAILIFLVLMTVMNIIGHLGYELYPKNFLKNPLLRWNNTSTHHNMHHRLVNCNYGLYFNFWDKWMGTNHKEYQKNFDRAAGT